MADVAVISVNYYYRVHTVYKRLKLTLSLEREKTEVVGRQVSETGNKYIRVSCKTNYCLGLNMMVM